jgi:hypothetical protein
MAASEQKLGDLHEAVADAFAEQVKGFVEQGEDGVEKVVRPSPALLGAAVAFLKNNNITADATQNEALVGLSKALQARRRKQLPQQALDEAADSFSRSGGGSALQ